MWLGCWETERFATRDWRLTVGAGRSRTEKVGVPLFWSSNPFLGMPIFTPVRKYVEHEEEMFQSCVTKCMERILIPFASVHVYFNSHLRRLTFMNKGTEK